MKRLDGQLADDLHMTGLCYTHCYCGIAVSVG